MLNKLAGAGDPVVGALGGAPPKLKPPAVGAAGAGAPKLKPPPAGCCGVEVVAPPKLKPVEAGAGGVGFACGCPPKPKEGVAEEVGVPNTPALLVVVVDPAPNTEPALFDPNDGAPKDGAVEAEVAPNAGAALEPNEGAELVDPNTLPDCEALGAAPNVGAAEGAAPPKLKPPALGVVVEAPNAGAAGVAVLAVFPKLNPPLELAVVEVAPNAGVLAAVELDPNEKPVVAAGGAAGGAAGAGVEPKLKPVAGAAEVFDGAPNKLGPPVEVVDVAGAPPKLKPVLGAELVAVGAAEPKLKPVLAAGAAVEAGGATFAVAVVAEFKEPKLKPPLAAGAAVFPAPDREGAGVVEDPKLKPVPGAGAAGGAAGGAVLPKAGTVELVFAPKLNPVEGAVDGAAEPKLNEGLVSGAAVAVGADIAAAKLGSFDPEDCEVG